MESSLGNETMESSLGNQTAETSLANEMGNAYLPTAAPVFFINVNTGFLLYFYFRVWLNKYGALSLIVMPGLI